MKKTVTSLLLILISFYGFSQNELSTFTATGRGGATTFATDYQAVGINPANLGWDSKFTDKNWALGFSEMTYSVYSPALEKQELRDNLHQMFKSIVSNDSLNQFTHQDKINLARDFTEAGFALNADFGSIGLAYHNEKIGGLALAFNDRFQWWSNLNQTASELLFIGWQAPYFDSLMVVNPTTFDTTTIANSNNISQDTLNMIASGFTNSPSWISQIYDGSEIQFSWTREYNLSYGRCLFQADSAIALFGGIGIKYVQGFAILDVTSVNGDLQAFSATTPFFRIDYGSGSQQNPSNTTGTGFPPKSVGHGWGIDLGANLIIKNKIKIGAAVTNIGSVTWDGNVYSAQDTLLYDTQTNGLNSWDMKNQLGSFAGDNGLFKWTGESSKVVKLPTVMRLGASWRVHKKLEIGADVVMPFNHAPGSYEKAIIGLGGDFIPVRWLKLSGGFVTGGNYKFQVPIGVLFILGGGTWEAGVASRDAISFFVNKGPTLSLSTGFLRFRF